MRRSFVLKRYCHDVPVDTRVIDAGSKEEALKLYANAQYVYTGPEDLSMWPRTGDAVSIDIQNKNK